jgi:Cu(I)/Ag(I) efflux system membrane protein CusA/SilA
MPNLWWMPIQTRTEMLATGVRSQLGVKVFGDDLAQVEQAAIAIAQALTSVPGTRNAFAERATGAFYLDARTDRARAARYGVSVEDVNTTLEAAIGGRPCRRRSPVESAMRSRSATRATSASDPEAVGRTLVPTSRWRSCRCASSRISRSRTARTWCAARPGKLVGLVAVDVAGRPIVDYVNEARRWSRARDAAAGTAIAWVGQFEYFERAKARLQIVLPITLALVALLLYLNTRSRSRPRWCCSRCRSR